MKRPIVLLLALSVLIGCRGARPGLNSWALLGPTRIPAPATGSIGRPLTTAPYYQQSASPQITSGIVSNVPTPSTSSTTLPLENSVTLPPRNSISLQPSPVVVTPGSTQSLVTTNPATARPTGSNQTLDVEGWRSPAGIIQRAGVQSTPSSNTSSPSVNSGTDGRTTSQPAENDRSVLIGAPIRVIEPPSTAPVASVVIHPMPVNDATVAVTEPRRLEVPDGLTEITNLPVVRQSVTAVSNDFEAIQSSVVGFTGNLASPTPNSGQWRAVVPEVTRAR